MAAGHGFGLSPETVFAIGAVFLSLYFRFDKAKFGFFYGQAVFFILEIEFFDRKCRFLSEQGGNEQLGDVVDDLDITVNPVKISVKRSYRKEKLLFV